MAVTRKQVAGLRELGAAMKALGDDIGLKISRSATGSAAAVVRKAWKAKAPVAKEPYKSNGQLIEPGNIGRNVIMKRLPRGESKLTSEHIVTIKHKGAGVKGQPYRAAILTEFGTVNMSAEPWARPAYEATKQKAADVMVDRLKKRIEKANKGSK